MSGEITYASDLADVTPERLSGFFDGWTNPPSSEAHVRILQGSHAVWLAFDDEHVVGFITAVSDGVLSAYISLLEVLPTYQGRGIGSELVRRMLTSLDHFYMVDLMCDEDLEPFYARMGMRAGTGMMKRNYDRQDPDTHRVTRVFRGA